jgi:uracil-DNA glycosylase
MNVFDYLGKWQKVMDKKLLLNTLNSLSKLNNNLICPDISKIFRAFKLCPFDDLKVVMLFQDPYPQRNIATGIALGNEEKDENKISPSLNVIKEACINFEVPHNFINFDHSLEAWEKQGVLLLNSSLTCELNKPGSHTMLWRHFMTDFIKRLSCYKAGIVYVLFGVQAQTFKPYISGFNDILEVNHPAYYARTNTKMPYKLFDTIDKLLVGKYGKSIQWYKEY